MNLNNLIPPTASPRPYSRGGQGVQGALGSASRASYNPAGGVGPSSAEGYNQRFKDRFSNMPATSKQQIERQREFDANKLKLQSEFDKVDRNRDGTITLDELQAFLDQKVRKARAAPSLI